MEAPLVSTAVVSPVGIRGRQARLALDLAERDGRTLLRDLHHQGPLGVEPAFYPEGSLCHLQVLYPPDGVIGGDHLEIAVEVADGAHGLITTAGPTEFRGNADVGARQHLRLCVAAGGVLEWLPQETVLGPGARVRLVTELDLAPGARFLGWEVLSLGRPALSEPFAHGRADLRLRVQRAGEPLLLERLLVADGEALNSPAGLRGHPVTATLLATGASAADLTAVRAAAGPGTAAEQLGVPGIASDQLGSVPTPLWAATLIEDLLIVRALAADTDPVRRLFAELWGILRPRLLGRPACPPPVWGT